MDAAVNTAEFSDLAFADVESRLAAAAKALKASGPATAMGAWTALADQFPHDPRIFRQAIPTLVSQCAWAEAEQIANAATNAFPRDIGFAAQWAEIAQKRHDWDEALRRWTEVRARFPRHAAGFIGAASTLRGMGQREKAEALLERAMGLFPQELEPLIDWAVIALEHRDFAEALFRFERLRRANPGEVFGIPAQRAHSVNWANLPKRRHCSKQRSNAFQTMSVLPATTPWLRTSAAIGPKQPCAGSGYGREHLIA